MASTYSSERPRRSTSNAALQLCQSQKRTAIVTSTSPQSSSTKSRRVSDVFSKDHSLGVSQAYQYQYQPFTTDERQDIKITLPQTKTGYQSYSRSVVDGGCASSVPLCTIDKNSGLRIAYPSLYTKAQQKMTSDMKQFSDVKPDKNLLDVKLATCLIAKPRLDHKHITSAFVSLPVLTNDVIIKAQSEASKVVIVNKNAFTRIKTEPQEFSNVFTAVPEATGIEVTHAHEVTSHPQIAQYCSSSSEEQISNQTFITNVKTEPDQSSYNVPNAVMPFVSLPEVVPVQVKNVPQFIAPSISYQSSYNVPNVVMPFVSLPEVVPMQVNNVPQSMAPSISFQSSYNVQNAVMPFVSIPQAAPVQVSNVQQSIAPSISYDSNIFANIKTEPESYGYENSDDRNFDSMETDMNLISTIKIEPFISDYNEENDCLGISGVSVKTERSEENSYVGISCVGIERVQPSIADTNYPSISGVSIETDNTERIYDGMSGVSKGADTSVVEERNDGASSASFQTVLVVEADNGNSDEADSESDFEPSSEYETESDDSDEDDSDTEYVPGKTSPPKVAVNPNINISKNVPVTCSNPPADAPAKVNAINKAPEKTTVMITAQNPAGDKPPSKEAKNNLKTTMKGGMAEVWCTLCDVKCLTEKAIITHKNPHTPQTPHKCSQCHKGFATPACLSTHKSSKIDICTPLPTPPPPPPLPPPPAPAPTPAAPVTAKSFLPKDMAAALESSEDKSHFKTIINKGIGDVWCTICSYKCESPSDILLHRKPHEPRTIYKCKKCSKYLPSAAELKKHKCSSVVEKKNPTSPAKEGASAAVVIRNIDEQYSCSECAVVCSDKSSLEKHMLTHGEETLTCTRCGVTCYSLVEMEAHIKTHSTS